MEIAGVTVYEFTPSLCENGGAVRFKVPKHPRSQIKGALLLHRGAGTLQGNSGSMGCSDVLWLDFPFKSMHCPTLVTTEPPTVRKHCAQSTDVT